MVFFLDNYMLAPFFLLVLNCEVSQTNDVKGVKVKNGVEKKHM